MSLVGLPAVDEALSRLPEGYSRLFTRLLRVVEPDERVLALWLSGSLGRGTADRGSDLDVVVSVADESFDDFCAGWRGWLATVTPTIIAREIPGLPGSFSSVTRGCERLDMVVERATHVDVGPTDTRLLVLDRMGLDGRGITPGRARPAEPTSVGDGRGPDRARMADLVEEFFRQQAIFPAAVVARDDWLLGVVAVVSTQRLLYDLLVEANQPLPVMGVKQWSSRLTGTQRRLLEALPVPDPRPDDVITAMLAVRRAMLTAGRDTADRHGVTWPTRADEAVAAYFAQELGTWSSDGTEDSASAANTSLTTRIASPGG